ncbi:hypothetical protein TIFTF001_030459 [Ficus carica]|uniref:Uncharacterized protein n=1 Tax=Ficus carica TaxID=3494 RepID=A0AA88J4V1_FICCA|nr:hypothetical protein TIFTF001_030393 [Ficus carica]GMN61359.1 hypothetical protein TIFTF001_030459 [Ficus carica]
MEVVRYAGETPRAQRGRASWNCCRNVKKKQFHRKKIVWTREGVPKKSRRVTTIEKRRFVSSGLLGIVSKAIAAPICIRCFVGIKLPFLQPSKATTRLTLSLTEMVLQYSKQYVNYTVKNHHYG